MIRPLRLIGDNVVYHVLNRANGKQKIFKKQGDYKAFEKIILEAKKKFPMRILSLCIMPNHWHFILYPETGEDMPKFMRWLTHTHTQRYHAHYGSTGHGHIYQGRYKAFPVQQDNHFLQVCRYVERNPLRAGLVNKAEEWRWSSMWIRSKGREEQKSLFSEWPVPRPDDYLEWVNMALKEDEESLAKIRYTIQRGRPFGRDDWARDTAEKFNMQSTLRERGRPKKIS